MHTRGGLCVSAHACASPPQQNKGRSGAAPALGQDSSPHPKLCFRISFQTAKRLQIFFFFLPSIDLTQIVQLRSKGILFFFRQKPPLQEPSTGNGSSPRRDASGTTSGPRTQLCPPAGPHFPPPDSRNAERALGNSGSSRLWKKPDHEGRGEARRAMGMLFPCQIGDPTAVEVKPPHQPRCSSSWW